MLLPAASWRRVQRPLGTADGGARGRMDIVFSRAAWFAVALMAADAAAGRQDALAGGLLLKMVVLRRRANHS